MFCPRCQAEYRPGFSRCANCDVDLVEEVGSASGVDAGRGVPGPPAPAGRLADFCGFLALDEAREARDRLREASIPSEIAIREAPDSPPDGPIEEEYWLRLSSSHRQTAQQVLGFDEPD